MKTEYLKLDPYRPGREKVKYVAEVLRRGGLVVIPTETVYGIGFDPESKPALERIVQVKRNRNRKPYTLCLPSMEWLRKFSLAESSWNNLQAIRDLLPGPITFLLEVRGRGISGFRIPLNFIAQEIVRSFSKPINLSSANVSGETPARCVQEAIDSLWGKVDLILDGGFSPLCLPSLVLDLSRKPVKILREGPPFVTAEVKRRFGIGS